jgi:hypothetical protein
LSLSKFVLISFSFPWIEKGFNDRDNLFTFSNRIVLFRIIHQAGHNNIDVVYVITKRGSLDDASIEPKEFTFLSGMIRNISASKTRCKQLGS